MSKAFDIRRERWSLKEIWQKDGDRPGRGAFALVLDDEHFPYFRHPQSNHLAEALIQAAAGSEAPSIVLDEGNPIRIVPEGDKVLVHSPAGARRQLSIGETRLLAKDLLSPLAQTLLGQR
ncbi:MULTISPECIES: hypothetical protein [unclassified Bradyrhizobium]|uniref:hypothetical protein n=1 Tax=unclassified Bradyrhizobium TaxID=2631580 RepID=UPI002915D6D2|nr:MULTISPECIES: hypothetical protein [unclassified Bradyrhizobium]